MRRLSQQEKLSAGEARGTFGNRSYFEALEAAGHVPRPLCSFSYGLISKTKSYPSVLRESSKRLLLLGIRNPSRLRDRTRSFIVKEELHLVIGLRARHRPVFCRTEAWRVVRRCQWSLGGGDRFAERSSDISLRCRKNSKRIPRDVGDANIVCDHRSIVGNRQPGQFHRPSDLRTRCP